MPKIGPITFKAGVGRASNYHQKIPRGAAGITARQTMTRYTQRHSFFDSGWDVDRERLFALHFTAGIALGARLLDELSPPAACSAGHDLLKGHSTFFAAADALAAPAARLAALRLRAGLGARTVTSWTGLRFREVNRFFAPCSDSFQRNLDHDFDIFAAHRTCVSWAKKTLEEPTAAKPEIKTAPAENFIEVYSAKQVFGREASHSRETGGIVFAPLLWI